MSTVYPLENTIQAYAWGSIDGIPHITGIENPDKKPMAELWMGAHSGAPSRVILENGTHPSLDRAIDLYPLKLMGANGIKCFGKKFPFLFKILSAASPLSLQVHPSKQQALEGFARENDLGIPISSPERNYRDDNQKSEILMALTDFSALCGFRQFAETLELFSMVGSPPLNTLLSRLKKDADYTSFCNDLLSFSREEAHVIINKTLASIAERRPEQVSAELRIAFDVMRTLADYYPDDIGVLSPMYLNVINLQRHQALYLPTGIMHAYIKGTGLELMNSSDNVLRGGLTPKHIDTPELFKILDPSPYTPAILSGEKKDGLLRYITPSMDFELATIEPTNEVISWQANFPAILLGADGTIIVGDAHGKQYKVQKGMTFFIPGTNETLTFTGIGLAYIASIPQKQAHTS